MENKTNIYHLTANALGALIESKQEAYGDAFGQCHKVFEVLYPQGVPPEKMKDFLAIVRVVDKLFRIAHHKEAFSENPWEDIAGYAILSLVNGLQGSGLINELSIIKANSNIGEATKKALKPAIKKVNKGRRPGRPKTKQSPGKGKFSIKRKFTTSDEDIQVIRNFFSRWRKENLFTVEQARALETIGVKKLSFLSRGEREQILNIFNDVREEINNG